MKKLLVGNPNCRYEDIIKLDLTETKKRLGLDLISSE